MLRVQMSRTLVTMVDRRNYGKTYETGRTTIWVRRLTLIVTGFISLGLLVGYPFLPNRIPTHFTLTGVADASGPKWTVFILIGIFCLLTAGLAWLSAHPQFFNYPIPVTEVNAGSVYQAAERMMVWLSAAIVMFFAGTALWIFGWSGGPLFVIGLIGVLVSLFVGIKRMTAAT